MYKKFNIKIWIEVWLRFKGLKEQLFLNHIMLCYGFHFICQEQIYLTPSE